MRPVFLALVSLVVIARCLPAGQPQVPAAARVFVRYAAPTGAQPMPAFGSPADGSVKVHRDLEYGRVGLVPLKLDLYLPSRARGTVLPAVIFIHGGGWALGDKRDGNEAESLARRGFVTASIDYRLAWLAKFPAQIEDCKASVRWMRYWSRRLGIDPNRIGVWGASAGGHLAMLLGCADASAGLEGGAGPRGVSSRVSAVCSFFGPSDLAGEFANPFTLGGQIVQFFMGPFRPAADFVRASPLRHVSAGDPPLLMIHGERDGLVPIRQSELMLDAYRKRGLDATLIRVKNADHGFMPKNLLQPVTPGEPERMNAVAAFFTRHLGGARRTQLAQAR